MEEIDKLVDINIITKEESEAIVEKLIKIGNITRVNTDDISKAFRRMNELCNNASFRMDDIVIAYKMSKLGRITSKNRNKYRVKLRKLKFNK